MEESSLITCNSKVGSYTLRQAKRRRGERADSGLS